MKQIFTFGKAFIYGLFMFLISFASANSINSITIIPEKPQAGDEIKIVVNSTLAGCFKLNSSTVTTDSISFNADAVYFETQPGCDCMCQYIDTFSLGKINEGNYYLVFSLYGKNANSSGNTLFDKDTLRFSVGQPTQYYSNTLFIAQAFPKEGDEIILVSKNDFKAGCNFLDSSAVSINDFNITAEGYHATPMCFVYDPYSVDSIPLGKLKAGTYNLTYYFKTHGFNSHNDSYASNLRFTVYGTKNNSIKALKLNPVKPHAGDEISVTGYFSDGNCTLQSKMTGITGTDIFVEASYNSMAMCPSKNDSSTALLGYLSEGSYRLIYKFTDYGTNDYDIDTLFFNVEILSGKCIPVDTLKILPLNPTEDGEIKLVVYYYADCCNKVDFSNPVISKDSAYIKILLSQSSPADTIIPCDCLTRMFADTIALGKLPVGFYKAVIITNPGCNNFLTLSFFVTSKNKCNFTTDLEIVPANPKEGDEIKVVGKAIFTSGGCNLIDKSVTINGSMIYVSTMHEMGMLTYICNSTDTISFGKLHWGKYQLIFTTQANTLNCLDTDTLSFVVAPSSATYTISGTVVAENTIVRNGVVILYHKSSEYFKPVQISHLDSGMYWFSGIKQGNYIIYAVPNYAIYTGYLPTYYKDAIYWKNADIIHVDGDKNQLNVLLRSFTSLLQGGEGCIKGTVTYDNDSIYEKDIYNISWFGNDSSESNSNAGNTAMNMPVILLDNQNNPVAWTLSDESGNFEFKGMPWGTYTLSDEKAGYDLANKPIINLNDSNSSENNVTITIRTEGIMLLLNKFIVDNKSVFLYPNPVIGNLNIAVNSEHNTSIILKIYNSTGQKVYEKQYYQSAGPGTIILNASEMNSGVYFIRLTIGNDKYLSLKFVK